MVWDYGIPATKGHQEKRPRNRNPIHEAIVQEDVKRLDALVSSRKGDDLSNDHHDNENDDDDVDQTLTPPPPFLHLAVLASNNKKAIAMMEILLNKAGMDINEKDKTTGKTVFHIVASKGMIPGMKNIIQFLLERNADLWAMDNLGRTPLMAACSDCTNVFSRRFIDTLGFDDESTRNSYISFQNPAGKTALHYALESPNPSHTVLELLHYSADPFIGDPTGSNILFGLLSSSSRVKDRYNNKRDDTLLQAISDLQDLGCDLTIQEGESGHTALHMWAKNCEMGNVNTESMLDTIMEKIVESDKTSYVNRLDRQGKSAFYYAMMNCDLPKVNMLIELSADPFVDDPSRSLTLFSLLLAPGGNRDGNQKEEKRVQTVRKLLELGSDPKGKRENGQTALHILAKERGGSLYFSRFVSCLMDFINDDESERRDYVNAIDDGGKSALCYMLEYSFVTSNLDVLFAFGVDPVVSDPTGSILLDLLKGLDVKNEADIFDRITRLLVVYHYDPTVQDENGQTALHILASNRRNLDYKKFLDLLLCHVVDGDGDAGESERSSTSSSSSLPSYINMMDREGKSALHYAATSLHYSSVVFHRLLEIHVNPNLQVANGETVLHILTKRSFWRLPKIWKFIGALLDCGADPTITDKEGRLPLYQLGCSERLDSTAVFLILRRMLEQAYC